jgi:hypothetical protein
VAVEGQGVALINGSVDPGRRRLNLAHELGHHLFDDAYAAEFTISPGDETERLINAFAVHLLLPRGDIVREWTARHDAREAAVWVAVRYRASWTALCAQLKNLELVDEEGRARLAATPPTTADFMELGERWVSELDAPSVPPDYGRAVVRGYRTGRLTAERAEELLHGTVQAVDLPEQEPIPLEGWRREFDPPS